LGPSENSSTPWCPKLVTGQGQIDHISRLRFPELLNGFTGKCVIATLEHRASIESRRIFLQKGVKSGCTTVGKTAEVTDFAQASFLVQPVPSKTKPGYCEAIRNFLI